MSDRLFSAIFNVPHSAPHFPYIYDSNAIISGGNTITTGAWRPWTTTDNGSTNVSISGGINVGNVAVTGGQLTLIGNPSVNVSNGVVPVSGATINNGGFVGITGTPNVNITNSVLAISGIVQTVVTGQINANITSIAVTGGSINVPYLTGGYSPVFTGLTNGQIQIPIGAKSYSVNVVSGIAFLQGTYLPVGTSVGGGQYGGGFLLNYNLNVGCTGGFTLVSWET